ncbi:MAG: hypothetical protein FWC43_00615 [Planctomycetaceae bacterium]|nr:hypothetical protein [Planctomycetaceae bacterium]
MKNKADFRFPISDFRFPIPDARCPMPCLGYAFLILMLLVVPLWAADEQSISEELYDLTSRRTVGSTDMVEVLLEVAGSTQQVSPDGKETTGSLKVAAGFRYEERVLDFQAGEKPVLKSLREYSLAKAKMELGKEPQTPSLDSNHKFVVCQINSKRASLFSPQGPLKSEQLLLIEEIPGNTLCLDLLLPPKPVKIGDSWNIPNSAVLPFLNVDGITQQTLEATLLSVVDDLAMVQIVGDSQGAYLGTYSEMTVNAKYQFDLRAHRINWVGMLLEEKRSIGHVGPGLDVKARLQVQISPLDEPKNLTDESLQAFRLNPNDAVLQLRYENGKGSWRFQHPRNWYIIQDEPGKTLLRMLDKGNLVAQCNIVAMPKIDPRRPTLLKQFADDLLKGLEKNSAKVIAAEESYNSATYHELRVILDGKVNGELPLRWVYFLLTDKNGYQTVVVFVIEAEQLSQFGDSDEKILDSFRMIN